MIPQLIGALAARIAILYDPLIQRGHSSPLGEISVTRQSGPSSLKLKLDTELDLALIIGYGLGDGRTSG
jgi:hypothetical protein